MNKEREILKQIDRYINEKSMLDPDGDILYDLVSIQHIQELIKAGLKND